MMGIIEEETKILEYLLDECMFVCAGLDYDDLQFSIRVVHKASCMGGIFSIYRGDYTGDEKNIIGVSVADVQRWTKVYGENVTQDMLCYGIAQEMYFLKEIENCCIADESTKRMAGHGVYYLKGELDNIDNMHNASAMCGIFRQLELHKQLIIPSYTIATDADAYALCILGMELEYYQKLLDNIVQSTVKEMVLVPSEYNTLLKKVRNGDVGRKNRVASRFMQMQRKKMCHALRSKLLYGQNALRILVISHICQWSHCSLLSRSCCIKGGYIQVIIILCCV